jgi:drug/metabolite transporter (DMT)-like permease
VLYSTAIKHITALEAVLLTTIEPILNPVWVFLALREAPGRWAILGGVIVLMAVTGRYAVRAVGKR